MGRIAATLACGIGLILAGFTFDVTILLVPGLGLGLVSILAPVWTWLASRQIDVTRSLGARRVVEGQPLELRLRIQRGWLWMPGPEVVDPVAGSMAVGRSQRVKLTARFPRRGRVRLDPPLVRVSDPLGMIAISRTGSCGSQEVLVLPQTDPVGWLEPRGGIGGDRVRRAAYEPWGASEIDGLREYRPGTPASRIHWPALARGAGLLERRLRSDGGPLPAVVLDPRSGGRDELLDAVVRAAASLVYELAARTGCELVLPGDRRPLQVGRDRAAWPEAHARLALVEDPGTGAALALPRVHGALFYLAAGELHEGWLSAVQPRQARQPFMLVRPRELIAPAPGAVRFSVAGCWGIWVEHRSRVAA